MSDAVRQQARQPHEPHVLSDQGGVNARILAREAKVDFRRIEAASLKLATRFTSAEGKRLFVRLFNSLQLNAHFVSVIARTKLDAEEVVRTETAIRSRLDAATAILNESIDEAEAQCKAQGITGLASYDALPLDVDVHVMSSTGRRYLELLVKLDQLMPMLQTLEIHEVLSTEAVDQRRARTKRLVRDVANNARRQAMLLRRRMNAVDSAGAGVRGGAREGSPSEAPAEEAVVVDDQDGTTNFDGGHALLVDAHAGQAEGDLASQLPAQPEPNGGADEAPDGGARPWQAAEAIPAAASWVQ